MATIPQAPLKKSGIIYQGATFDDTTFNPIAVKNLADGSIFDLTSWTPSAKLRKKFSDIVAVASFTCAKNTTTGEVRISLTATETAAIPAAETGIDYVYDIELHHSGGVTVRRIAQGILTCLPEATK
jgi:hypothetical protein